MFYYCRILLWSIWFVIILQHFRDIQLFWGEGLQHSYSGPIWIFVFFLNCTTHVYCKSNITCTWFSYDLYNNIITLMYVSGMNCEFYNTSNSLIHPYKPVYEYGEIVVFICQPGFHGTTVVSKCTGINIWNPPPQTCKSKQTFKIIRTNKWIIWWHYNKLMFIFTDFDSTLVFPICFMHMFPKNNS